MDYPRLSESSLPPTRICSAVRERMRRRSHDQIHVGIEYSVALQNFHRLPRKPTAIMGSFAHDTWGTISDLQLACSASMSNILQDTASKMWKILTAVGTGLWLFFFPALAISKERGS